ncbi:hypothetical protein AKO1_013954 [Acrasis kona]|uniref:JmjC domain-containing protein n=1 Tax=Acrasis kona TaxID=1008807 RepID=A0AAW2Z2V7_9EUKA
MKKNRLFKSLTPQNAQSLDGGSADSVCEISPPLTQSKSLKRRNSTQKQQAAELKNGNKKQKVLKCVERYCASQPPQIDPSDGVLESFLHPIKIDEFMDTFWKKRAFVSASPNLKAAKKRIGHICEAFLHDLQLEELIEDTSSDRPFVWMRDVDDTSSDKPLTSMALESTESAMICHKAGGSLYFRAPPLCEKAFLSQITMELGINFAAVFPSDGAQKAEIETFVSRKGHVTPFHFDFMENFTIQLTGKKKWTFLPLESTHPLRGATPHYKKQDTLEQQLKIHQIKNVNFTLKPSEAQLAQKIQVELGPGDCFYFPAGMYHMTECTEEEDHGAISINMSLIATSWSDVVVDGLKQILNVHDQWRAGISNIHSVQDARNQLTPLLDQLKSGKLFEDLTAERLIPNQGLILPRQRVLDFCTGQLTTSQQSNIKGSDSFAFNPLFILIHVPSEHDEGEQEEEDDDSDNEQEEGENQEEDDDEDSNEENEITESELLESIQDASGSRIKYVLHGNFGNESFESLLRVVFYVPEELHSSLEFIRTHKTQFKMEQIPNFTSNKYLLTSLVESFVEHGYLEKQ